MLPRFGSDHREQSSQDGGAIVRFLPEKVIGVTSV